MSNSNLLIAAFSTSLLAAAVPLLQWWLRRRAAHPKQTRLTFYVHDYLTGPDASAVTVAGRDGASTSVLHFGTLVAVDDPVTEGPELSSRELGRAQGMYINSQIDGKGLHLVFSVIFTAGEYEGSTLEIQGADPFGAAEREFSVVGGTGLFRFVRGFGIMTTGKMDIANLKGVLKLDVTVNHY